MPSQHSKNYPTRLVNYYYALLPFLSSDSPAGQRAAFMKRYSHEQALREPSDSADGTKTLCTKKSIDSYQPMPIALDDVTVGYGSGILTRARSASPHPRGRRARQHFAQSSIAYCRGQRSSRRARLFYSGER